MIHIDVETSVRICDLDGNISFQMIIRDTFPAQF